MFHKILIANRGEIALRILRAARDLGIKVAIVYSKADENTLPVQLADEKLCIGPADSARSYLNIHQIIAAAKILNADAIHPGYGFLAENADFANICEQYGITFIGPKSEIIAKMGDKSTARETMAELGIPLVPGSGLIQDLEHARKVAQEIGYPVLIKATAGGGGKGMRICESSTQLEMQLQSAQVEAQKAFGDSSVYMEKYIPSPKHIEVQVMGDNYGKVLHFFERDCSLQRRHQKIVEEAPASTIDPELRRDLAEKSARALEKIGYTGAGTLEFLYDQTSQQFYFIEMNTRIQVEHPITEQITSVDLLKLQIMVAFGERIPYSQDQIKIQGYAIECRINAEDASKNFQPSPGKILQVIPPGGAGIRWDSHVYSGYTFPPFYDSLLGKLIAYGSDRQEAMARMRRALREFQIEGITTTIPFHQMLFEHPLFIEGTYTTHSLSSIEIVL